MRTYNGLVFFICLLISPSLFAGEADVLGPDKWPENVEAAVKLIIADLPEADRKTVRNTRKEDLIKFHFGWGMGIRNHYGLWRGNQKLIASACGKPCHPDDASMKIIEAVWAELQQ